MIIGKVRTTDHYHNFGGNCTVRRKKKKKKEWCYCGFNDMLEIKVLISWCFEPSQPPGVTSGLEIKVSWEGDWTASGGSSFQALCQENQAASLIRWPKCWWTFSSHALCILNQGESWGRSDLSQRQSSAVISPDNVDKTNSHDCMMQSMNNPQCSRRGGDEWGIW